MPLRLGVVMTEIHIVNASNAAFYADCMEAYFRKRHDVFVEERGWSSLRKADCREIDEFDNDDAVYLLALDGEKLAGGQRLYPTSLPHMISKHFMQLVERPLPHGVTTSEWTRYFVTRERRTGRTDCRLLAAVQRYCLEEGISQLTAVVEMWWLPRWHQAGFKVRPLGLPQMIEGQPTLAVCIAVSEESLASVCALGGLKPFELKRQMMDAPRDRRVAHAA